jgi:hypothetical protein
MVVVKGEKARIEIALGALKRTPPRRRRRHSILVTTASFLMPLFL